MIFGQFYELKTVWARGFKPETLYDGRTHGRVLGERAILFYLDFDTRGKLRSERRLQASLDLAVADCATVASLLLDEESVIRKVAMHGNYLNVNWVRAED